MNNSLATRAPLALLAAVAYFLSSRLAYELAIPGGVVTLWLPTGVMLALFLRAEPAAWPSLFASAIVGSVASDALQGYPLGFLFAAALVNAAQCAGIAWLASRRLSVPVSIITVRASLELAVIVVGGTAVTAIMGGAIMALWFPRPFMQAWLVWWVGDGLGALVVLPALLVWSDTRVWFRTRRKAVLAQGAALFLALAVVSQLVLGTETVWSQPYMVLPFLYLLTIRLGLRGAAIGSLTVALIAAGNAAHGNSPLVIDATSHLVSALRLYVYVGFVSLSSFFTAAVLAERLAAKKALLASRERTDFALQAANVGVWEVNLRTGEAFWSETCEAMHGLEPGTFGQTFEAFVAVVHPADAARMRADVQRAIDTRTDAVLEYRVPLPDGRERLVRTHGRFFYDAAGVPMRGAGVAVDLTGQRDLEAQLRQSRKMDVLGQLAAGVAHDFNNILTVIQGYAVMVQEQTLPDSPIREDIDELLLGVQRAEGLTRQLLAFSRRQMLAPKVFDLGALVVGMLPMLRRLLGEHIRIESATPASIAHVKADPGQIEQVVLNLAVNARDAMPAGGTLTLALTVRATEAVLRVSDTGIGMSPVILDHIFEPFFTTKQAGKGTGLGLATVHGIVERSDGRIEVESIPGTGTTFTISLPLEESVGTSASSRRKLPGVAHGEMILVVEDELELRRLVQRILQSAGYEVLPAGSANEALRLMRTSTRLNLLLTDVVLPGINGRELADLIRQDRPELPILYMSGFTDDEVMLRGVKVGGTALIQKPFDPLTLLERVREILDRAY